MDTSITSLNSRLQKLKSELEYAERRRADEARKAVEALGRITEDEVEMLSSIVPQLRVVVKYTADDIKSNSKGEVQNIQNVMDTLRNYVEKRLSFYEDQL